MERWQTAGPLAPSYHQCTDMVKPGIRVVRKMSKRWVTVVVLRLNMYTGKKDYLGAHNSADSQVDFNNYFRCDVPPAVMST
eukprot:8465795-Ditylum_brightwellii.AAC.1